MLIKGLIIFKVILLINAIDVRNLVNRMSVEDKCGQMTQVVIDLVKKDSNDPTYLINPVDINKLRTVLKNYKIGSILGLPSLDVKVSQAAIRTIQDVALNETDFHVPIIYGTDSIHGVFVNESVFFPEPINMAATFNTDLVGKIASVLAKETRATGIPWNFSPVLDIGRQPLWSRLYETFGEDVYLASKMAEVFIKGHQGSNLKGRKVAANCLKHFVGYSYPFNGRDRSVAWIPEILLREKFLPPFESGIRAGALTVMINSGDVNGVPGHANYQYLTEILKGEWGFKGFTVSDWEDIKRLNYRDKVAQSQEEAVYIAVMAGIDMSMVPLDYSFYSHCVNLTKKKPEFLKRVDDAAYRILYVKNELGLFDDPYPHVEDAGDVGLPESETLSLTSAQESVILAKNTNSVLPLKKNLRILVTGPAGNDMNIINGGWSIFWDPSDEYGRKKFTIVNALVNRTSLDQIKFVQGVKVNSIIDINAVIVAANQADVIVLCIGEEAYAETPGNIDNMMISDSQLTLARELIKLNKPLIVVYAGGRPRIITEIAEKADAVIVAFLPGNRGGEAIADIIYGNVNPSARFPITYPRGINGHMNYDHKPLESPYSTTNNRFPDNYDPLYPFGFGLSYTTFVYSNLVLNTSNVIAPNGIKGRVDVKNTGTRSGQEVVIVYLNDEYCSVTRSVKEMKSFKKINLNVNEVQTVEFEISLKEMSYYNMQNMRVYEQGKFNIYVSQLTVSFNLVCAAKICKF
jgi:beta-glucosidase